MMHGTRMKHMRGRNLGGLWKNFNPTLSSGSETQPTVLAIGSPNRQSVAGGPIGPIRQAWSHVVTCNLAWIRQRRLSMAGEKHRLIAVCTLRWSHCSHNGNIQLYSWKWMMLGVLISPIATDFQLLQ